MAGSFDTSFKIAADYDIILRFLGKYQISTHYIPEVLIKMRLGGESNKSLRPDYHLINLETVLLPAVNIIGFDTKAAYVCGRIRAELEKRGTPLDLADLEIAAIAIANNLILVTNNVRHFERVPLLQYENWL